MSLRSISGRAGALLVWLSCASAVAARPLLRAAGSASLAAPASVAQSASTGASAAYVSETPAALLTSAELDGDAREELIFVGMRGELRILATGPDRDGPDGSAPGSDMRGQLLARGPDRLLAHPLRSLVTLADVLELGHDQLVVLDEDGLRLYPVEAGAGFSSEPLVLSRRAKLGARTTRPLLSPFLRDVNGDGHLDLLVPDPGGVELWLSSGPKPEGGLPSFSRVARIDSEAQVGSSSEAEQLSDHLDSSLHIPDLRTEDLNGDGREDIIVSRGDKHAFHMQSADGHFSAQPDVRLDLGIFEDRSPRPALRPGEILSQGDDRQFSRRDLDGDGIPDYVISHRRKVWVFHGSEAGPQFSEPSTILKVAEDVTALLILALDDDEYPDLLLMKVEVPGIAALLGGLLSSWSVDVRAIGYRSEEGLRFDTKPKWRRELEMSLPPILDLVRHPERFVKKFEGVGDKFRAPSRGDFDGDGTLDMLLTDEKQETIGLWRTQERARDDAGRQRREAERRLASLLFDSKQASWDLDRMLETISAYASERLDTLTAGREADQRFALRPAQEFEFLRALALDLDGDGADEILLTYAGARAAHLLTIDRVLAAPATPR